MPFYTSQLGRFGDIVNSLVNVADPDHKAAHLYAQDGHIIGGSTSRPTLQALLGAKGFWDPNDPAWMGWQAYFGAMRNTYMNRGGHPLTSRCTTRWPGFQLGWCGHELVPPLSHSNLRGFSARMGSLPDNVNIWPDGSVHLDPAARPVWNYVVTSVGDILVSPEDYELIKHTCVAGGAEVWAAGQIGIQQGSIRVIDLQSGHYVRSNIAPATALANALIDFTREVFRAYENQLGIGCLHGNFESVWA